MQRIVARGASHDTDPRVLKQIIHILWQNSGAQKNGPQRRTVTFDDQSCCLGLSIQDTPDQNCI